MPAVTLPRLLADDASPERLGTLLHDNAGRLALMSPEGDVFDLIAGRYSVNNAPNLGVYLKGHAGDAMRDPLIGSYNPYNPCNAHLDTNLGVSRDSRSPIGQ